MGTELSLTLWRRVFGYLSDRWGLLSLVCRKWRFFLFPLTVSPHTSLRVAFESPSLMNFLRVTQSLDNTPLVRSPFPLDALDQSPFPDKTLLLDLSLTLPLIFRPADIQRSLSKHFFVIKTPLQSPAIAHWFWRRGWLTLEDTWALSQVLRDDPDPLSSLERANLISFGDADHLVNSSNAIRSLGRLLVLLDCQDLRAVSFFQIMWSHEVAETVLTSNHLSLQRKREWIIWLGGQEFNTRVQVHVRFPLSFWLNHLLEWVMVKIPDIDEAFSLMTMLTQVLHDEIHSKLCDHHHVLLIAAMIYDASHHGLPLCDSVLSRLVHQRRHGIHSQVIPEAWFWRHLMSNVSSDLFLYLFECWGFRLNCPTDLDLSAFFRDHFQWPLARNHDGRDASRLWSWCQYMHSHRQQYDIHPSGEEQKLMFTLSVQEFHLPLLRWLIEELKFAPPPDLSVRLLQKALQNVPLSSSSCPIEKKSCLAFLKWYLTQEFLRPHLKYLREIHHPFLMAGSLEDIQWILSWIKNDLHLPRSEIHEVEFDLFFWSLVRTKIHSCDQMIEQLWQWYWDTFLIEKHFTLSVNEQCALTAKALTHWQLLEWLRSHRFAWTPHTRQLALSRDFHDPWPSSSSKDPKNKKRSNPPSRIYPTRQIKKVRIAMDVVIQ